MPQIKLFLNEIELHALNLCLNAAGNAEAWASAQENTSNPYAAALLRVARKIATADLS